MPKKVLKGQRRKLKDSFAFDQLQKSGLVRAQWLGGQSPIESTGTISNGDWYYFRARGNCAAIWFAPSEKMEDICLSYFIERVTKDWFAAGYMPYAEAADLIIGYARKYLDGERRWDTIRDDPSDYPGEAVLFGLPLGSAIAQAMQAHAEASLANADDLEKFVIGALPKQDGWTRSNSGFSRPSQRNHGNNISLVIDSSIDAHAEVEQVIHAFDSGTIVFVPKTQGCFYLYAIDTCNGKKTCSRIVDSWPEYGKFAPEPDT